MAYKPTSFDGAVGNPDADNPDGKLENSNPQGSGTGTRPNFKMLDQMVQFFAKLMRDAGITPNNSPENESNGYQFFDAFKYFSIGEDWQDLTTSSGASIYGDDTPQYKINNALNKIELRGTVQCSSASINNCIEAGGIPADYRPFDTGSGGTGGIPFAVGVIGVGLDARRLLINADGGVGLADTVSEIVSLNGISWYKPPTP